MRLLRDRADLDAAFSSLAFEGEATEGQRRALVRELINAIEFYYLHDDPMAYKRWREEAGARLRPRSDLEGPGPWPLSESIDFINAAHAKQGFHVDTTDSVEGLFDQFWRIRREFNDKANAPVAIADSGVGLLARFRTGVVDPRIDPDFAGELGQVAWYGGVVLSNRTWYDDPRVTALAQQESLVAQCGVVLEFTDGLRRPIHFTLIWDPDSRLWRIRFVLMTNSPAGYAMWPWEL